MQKMATVRLTVNNTMRIILLPFPSSWHLFCNIWTVELPPFSTFWFYFSTASPLISARFVKTFQEYELTSHKKEVQCQPPDRLMLAYHFHRTFHFLNIQADTYSWTFQLCPHTFRQHDSCEAFHYIRWLKKICQSRHWTGVDQVNSLKKKNVSTDHTVLGSTPEFNLDHNAPLARYLGAILNGYRYPCTCATSTRS